MGHLAGKDLFRDVGRKIDNLTVRAPWNDSLRAIVEEVFSRDEAELYVKMPYGLATVDRLERITGFGRGKLEDLLGRMADKGLVVDVWLRDGYQYMPSPFLIGIFEFTMMRTGGEVDSSLLGRLFAAYVEGGALYAANCADGASFGVIRALPHDDSVRDGVEILDYERAAAIVGRAERFAVGLCSCRHEKTHAGTRGCDGPLDLCTSLDLGADYLVRHGLAREIPRGEMLDRIAASRELGLVLAADNVQRNVTFICHCCRCCCNVLLGIHRFGYPSTIVSSSFAARVDHDACLGCGRCVKACPIAAIEMVAPAAAAPGARARDGRRDRTGDARVGGVEPRRFPSVDPALCIGCGVCAPHCAPRAIRLEPRPRRVIHPETTFERVILQGLEHGTLANQIFDDATSVGQEAMRAILGAFLALPPVKKALMSDLLRSRFLGALKSAVAFQGKGEVVDL